MNDAKERIHKWGNNMTLTVGLCLYWYKWRTITRWCYLRERRVYSKKRTIVLHQRWQQASKHARTLTYNRTTYLRQMCLLEVHTPQELLTFVLQEDVELAALKIRSKPFHDNEEHQPLCYRCSTTNPLVNAGNACINCQHEFVYSFVSFGQWHHCIYLLCCIM